MDAIVSEPTRVVAMDRSLAGTVLADAVGARPTASAAPDTTGPHPFTSSGRVVLGCGANIAHLAELRAAADEAGLQPAIFAAAMERHAGMSVADAVDSVARSFAVAHGLHRPWKTLPDVPLPDAAGVSLNVVLDEGTVEGLRGPRRDASHVVVLDGIFDEKDRREIMGEAACVAPRVHVGGLGWVSGCQVTPRLSSTHCGSRAGWRTQGDPCRRGGPWPVRITRAALRRGV